MTRKKLYVNAGLLLICAGILFYSAVRSESRRLQSQAAHVCGDGVIQKGETCDDGNVRSRDGCNGSCLVEGDYTCTDVPSVCTLPSETRAQTSVARLYCGDGIVSPMIGEECEPRPVSATQADTVNQQTVVTMGFGPNPSCGTFCEAPSSGPPPVPGCRWKLMPPCLPATLDAKSSSSTLPAVILSAEPASSSSVASSLSSSTSPSSSFTSSSPPAQDPPPPPAASSRPSLIQFSSPSLEESPPPPVCGNGEVEQGESCDDGNAAERDGCSDTCTVEPPACGNGERDRDEECDDSNLRNGDGCSVFCRIEPAPSPTVQPPPLKPPPPAPREPEPLPSLPEKEQTAVQASLGFVVFVGSSIIGFLAGILAGLQWSKMKA